MILDKIVNNLIANNTEYIFTETEDGVYISTTFVDTFQLLIKLMPDETKGLVLVSGTLGLGGVDIHTYTYVEDNYEQVLLTLINLRIKATNIIKQIEEFSEWK